MSYRLWNNTNQEVPVQLRNKGFLYEFTILGNFFVEVVDQDSYTEQAKTLIRKNILREEFIPSQTEGHVVLLPGTILVTIEGCTVTSFVVTPSSAWPFDTTSAMDSLGFTISNPILQLLGFPSSILTFPPGSGAFPSYSNGLVSACDPNTAHNGVYGATLTGISTSTETPNVLHSTDYILAGIGDIYDMNNLYPGSTYFNLYTAGV